MKTFVETVKEYKFPITTTDRKRQIIANENTFINKIVNSRDPTEQLVGVVGREEGLNRHIQQFIDLGFKQSNILLFELDENMANELKQAAIGKLPQYTVDENGHVQVAIDVLTKEEKVRVEYADILHPFNDFIKHNQPWFDRTKVTHVDLDFTTTLNEPDLINEVNRVFKAYPNTKSLVCVHSLRGSNTRTNTANIALSGHLKKLDSFFAKGVMSTKTGKPKTRVAEFRNVYDYYTHRETNNSGKQEFLKRLQQLCGGSLYVQSYQGASTKDPGKEGGAMMVSFTFVRNGPAEIHADNSIYKNGNITNTDKIYFPQLYTLFKCFYENSKTPEGFAQNEHLLNLKEVESYTESDYEYFMKLLDDMFEWFEQQIITL